jgi:hypothetical protein
MCQVFRRQGEFGDGGGDLGADSDDVGRPFRLKSAGGWQAALLVVWNFLHNPLGVNGRARGSSLVVSSEVGRWILFDKVDWIPG